MYMFMTIHVKQIIGIYLRSEVRVYRTIGSLVCIFSSIFISALQIYGENFSALVKSVAYLP